MIQLIAASTAYQVASLVAMIDSGALPPITGERVLVLADGSQIPEITTPIAHSPASPISAPDSTASSIWAN